MIGGNKFANPRYPKIPKTAVYFSEPAFNVNPCVVFLDATLIVILTILSRFTFVLDYF